MSPLWTGSLAGLVVLAALAVLLLATSRWWLARLLSALDRLLVRLGVGTWAAGAITWLEQKARERKERNRR